MFDSRDRRSWYLPSLHELGLDPKLNLAPLNFLVLVVILQFVFCTASGWGSYHAHVHMMGSKCLQTVLYASSFFSHPHWPKRCLLLYIVLHAGQYMARLLSVPVNRPSSEVGVNPLLIIFCPIIHMHMSHSLKPYHQHAIWIQQHDTQSFTAEDKMYTQHTEGLVLVHITVGVNTVR